jgi:hypothetical protein
VPWFQAELALEKRKVRAEDTIVLIGKSVFQPAKQMRLASYKAFLGEQLPVFRQVAMSNLQPNKYSEL